LLVPNNFLPPNQLWTKQTLKMTIIVFLGWRIFDSLFLTKIKTPVNLVDDSPSMNQVSYMGTTLIDFARQIVESFIKVYSFNGFMKL
jgi:hypothetical protein